MIRARTVGGLTILGLDAENIRRLTNGEPILSRMRGEDILILYGATLADVQRQIERHFGPVPKELLEPENKDGGGKSA